MVTHRHCNKQLFDFRRGESRFMGPGEVGYIWERISNNKKNEIGTSLSSWAANGDNLIIWTVSVSRDIEIWFSHATVI